MPITRQCIVCGTTFSVKPYVVKCSQGLFCSVKCKGVYQKQSLLGKNNPNYGNPGTEKQLISARKPKTKEHRDKLSAARMGMKPSEETRAKYRTRKQQLAKDPDYLEKNRCSVILARNEIWYGGVKYDEPKYCELWNENLRERCRAFFGYVCLECGTPQNGRKLGVHHVHYNKKTCCDGSPRDLVPLCTECHGHTTSGNRKYWEAHFTEMLYTYYGGKCFFTKEEMKQFTSAS